MKMLARLAVLFLLVASAPIIASSPGAGEGAPDFRLQDQNEEWRSLADYQGEWLILYFYPRDFTPGCTTEACAFRDDIFEFRKMGVRIVGVSVDDTASHEDFAEEYSLPFPLLADTDGAVSKSYGTYGTTASGVGIATRQTFVINPEGKIAMHYPKVDADTHSQQLQSDLPRLMVDPEG